MKYTAQKIMLIILSSTALNVNAQNFSEILQSIDQNSTSLKTLKMQQEVQILENRALNAFYETEFGFNYLFGNDNLGNRTDFEIKQSFDFPTVTAQKKKLINEHNRVAEFNFFSQRQKILLTAKKLCIQVVYCNAMLNHLNEDLAETQALKESYEKLFENGEATIYDRNKAHQSLLMFQAEYREFQALHRNLLNELKYLNGGQEVVISDSTFENEPMVYDIEDLLTEKNPEIMLAKEQIAESEQELKVAKNMYAPKLSVGYMSEKEKVDHYQGITVGVSIPLFGNAQNVKIVKAKLLANQTAMDDSERNIKNRYETIINDIEQLQQTHEELQHHLTECDNTSMLQKALKSGQITLLDYLIELQYVHELHEKALEVEMELKMRKAELEIF